jgi:hypothetical protein
MPRTLLIALPLALTIAACATLPPPISVDDALAMAKSGKTPDAIIADMRASRSTYRLSASDVLRLNKAGLPEPVLDYMLQTQLDEVRSDERARDMSAPNFYPWWRRW